MLFIPPILHPERPATFAPKGSSDARHRRIHCPGHSKLSSYLLIDRQIENQILFVRQHFIFVCLLMGLLILLAAGLSPPPSTSTPTGGHADGALTSATTKHSSLRVPMALKTYIRRLTKNDIKKCP
jgi:hypothetical protein